MSWFRKKDPPPRKFYYDLYEFEPKDDITAYELSLLLSGQLFKIDKNDRTFLDVVGRHFRFCGEE